MLAGLRAYVTALLRRNTIDAEVAEELRFHVEMETEANLRRGMPPAEARRVALRDLGGVTQTQESIRGLRMLWVESVWQDVRHAFRLHARRPLATTLVLAALALAMGTTTGVFGVVNGLLLRPLPFARATRLVELSFLPRRANESAKGFHEWRTRRPYLEDAALWETVAANLGLEAGTQRVTLTRTSSNFFSALGSAAELGRTFVEGEDAPGRDFVAVISHAFWESLLGGDPSAVGSSLRVNGETYTVVGIAPPENDFPHHTALWTPAVFDRARDRGAQVPVKGVLGVLKAGMTLRQAAAGLAAEIQATGPFDTAMTKSRGSSELPLTLLMDRLSGPSRRASLALMALVAFVLLIACANAANVALMRACERRRELAVRAALGASRGRLVRQHVIESLALCAAAGLAGLPIALWVTRLVASAQPPELASQRYTLADWRVFVWAAVVVAGATLVSGVVPALVSTARRTDDGLRVQPSGGTPPRDRRTRHALVALQAGIALVLLTGAVSFGRTFAQLVTTDLGLRTDRVVTVSVELAGTRYQGREFQLQYVRDALDRLRSVPSVLSVAAVEVLPLELTPFIPGGASAAAAGAYYVAASGRSQIVGVVVATPGYFRTMSIDIVEGREFAESDRTSGEPLAVISEEMARTLEPDQRRVGSRFRLAGFDPPAYRVIGVVRAVRERGPAYAGRPLVYVLSEHRRTTPRQMTFVASVGDSTDVSAASCLSAVRSLDRDVPMSGPFTLEERLWSILARPRFYTIAVAFLASFAMLLAVAGIYGTAAYAVVQRTHEIGVRLAVGADAARLRTGLVLQTLLPVTGGAAGGIAASLALTGLTAEMMAPPEPVGLGTCVLAAAVLCTSAAAASWLAAAGVTRLNPLEVLRSE